VPFDAPTAVAMLLAIGRRPVTPVRLAADRRNEPHVNHSIGRGSHPVQEFARRSRRRAAWP
jgi:hypothetical protein